MRDTIYDVVGAEIAPFLVHLGEQDVAPTVHRVVDAWEDPDFVNEGLDVPPRTNVELAIERIPGERWSTALEEREPDRLYAVAESIGHHVAYLANGGVSHRDLHTANVWVDERTGAPVLTDWDMAAREQDPKGDLEQLLGDTRRRLGAAGRSAQYAPVKDAYLDGFRAGADASWDVTGDELRQAYQALF